ncbi:hypothetical protein [Peribacillus deserti]|uniref:Flagellar hook-length control protein-like C-terminal domain-containing protein n=1 Tax=Peribacillus deserti TaxID=673318 RepID=A0A2N5M6V1_9BACI|nr:hypothetical protein [Peribacillus deserti]PLT30080.1 hypothetical protein CUU66_09445 [Peribacillus deserti]
MQAGQILKNLIPQTASVSASSFRTGQIIHGTITKLFPNQTAEVRIGQTKLIAVIEAPLKALEKYWFRVEAGEDLTRLKVLETKSGQQVNDAAQLLHQLSLGAGKEQLKLASFFLNNGIPATREILENAISWVQAAEDFDLGMASVKTMHIKNIPLTEENFQAIYSLETGKPLSSLLGRLTEQLSSFSEHSPASLKLLKAARALVETNAVKWADKALLELTRIWLTDPTSSPRAFQMLKSFGFVAAGSNEQQVLNSLLEHKELEKLQDPRLKQGLDILWKFSSASNVQDREAAVELLADWDPNGKGSTLFSGAAERVKSPIAADEQTGHPEMLNKREAAVLIKNLLVNLLGKSGPKENADAADWANDLKTLFSIGHESKYDSHLMLGRTIAALSDGGAPPEKGALPEGVDWLYSKLNQELVRPNFSNGKDVKNYFKQIIKELGLDQFLTASMQEAETSSSLKLALSEFLHTSETGQVKQTAEQLLHRIHAQALLSSESGPLQNMVMQIPVSFNEHVSDLTVQWTGRKKSDGSIDSDYCRILFYLELSSLKEVAVDMQVQNRIVRLTIYNEYAEPIKNLAQQWIPSLKEHFANIRYTLSSIHFNSSQGQAVFASPNHFQHQSPSYSGVDFKI